jgi:hypothetical protein
LTGGITITPDQYTTKNAKLVVTTYFPKAGMKNHAVFKVTLPDGTVGYFDIGAKTNLGNFGGADHWFFMKNAPKGGVPSGEFFDLMDKSSRVPYDPNNIPE